MPLPNGITIASRNRQLGPNCWVPTAHQSGRLDNISRKHGAMYIYVRHIVQDNSIEDRVLVYIPLVVWAGHRVERPDLRWEPVKEEKV